MKTRLQELRQAAGYKNPRQFAELVGINPRTYVNYEQGVSRLTLDLAWKFADALGCTIDDIAGREHVPDELTRDERHVIDAMRSTDERGRDVIVAIAEAQPGDER